MNPWMDAIDKLRFHGYSVTLNEGRLRYTYQGKGNPPQDEIIPLLEVLKAHKGEILNDPYFLIEQTLQRINEGWESGTLEWIKVNRPDEWGKVIALEQEINEAAFERDFGKLKKVLERYQELFTKLKGRMAIG